MSNSENGITESILVATGEVSGRPFMTDSVTGDTSIYDLGIDSMSLVELIFKLESDLDMDIPVAELNEDIFANLDSLSAYLSSRRRVTAQGDELVNAESTK